MADKQRWTMDQLREIVSAGMSVAEAKLLLEDGYSPDDVLGLAQLQREQRSAAATEAQTATAKAMQKAMRPENTDHPGVSAFSYPEGDLERPRPALKCEMWYWNYPMHLFPETEHWRELELANEIEPGEYTILRKDETTITIEVHGERDADGKLKVLKIGSREPVNREEKWLIPAKAVVLYQLAYAKTGTPKRVYLKAMQEHLNITLRDPEPAPVRA
jgi:hypothetical protein